ncbi:hypothetical protein PESP_a2970 [Pseudoalteromonas espejiana DSM 9414]|nr:hypothetical protein PESP_a2970 [Pseudoalteromonas espejiana DSM 9414]
MGLNKLLLTIFKLIVGHVSFCLYNAQKLVLRCSFSTIYSS